MLFKSVVALSIFSVAQLASAHSAMIRATGDMGGSAAAFGVVESTPRNGANRNPFQQDSTVFRGATADQCGRTIQGGPNRINEDGVSRLMAKTDTLPKVSRNGVLDMTIHQVNGDGAGPYTCAIDASGTGNNWQPVSQNNVLSNVPGRNGNSRARATDFTLSVRVPDSVNCSGNMGGQDNVCMMRCNNRARAGPFGGCVPFVQDSAATGKSDQVAVGNDRAVNSRVPTNRKKFNKREPASKASYADEDLENDPEFLAELRAEGEDI